uniref:Uncharacterized protein n=1 Tax=viral metagenome TaxID=1070528 RepID=A0A6C0M175_9ZZZZ
MSSKKSVASIVPAINLQSAIHIGAEVFVIGAVFFYVKKEISALRQENVKLKHEMAIFSSELANIKEALSPKHPQATTRSTQQHPPHPPHPPDDVHEDEDAVEDEIQNIARSRNDLKNETVNDEELPPNPFIDE